MNTMIEVAVPVGRKALIVTREVRYDEKGEWIGYEVVEVENTFTRKEAERLQQVLGCPECGGIGTHKSYFVSTGQHPCGSVEGYTKKCSRGEQ